MPEVSDEVVWYYALAVDTTGNWDRVPNPDYGNYAYFQPPFDVCTVTPRAPVLSLTSTTTGAVLTWTAPTEYDNGIAIAAGDTLTYDVYVKSAGGDPWPSVPAGGEPLRDELSATPRTCSPAPTTTWSGRRTPARRHRAPASTRTS